MRIVIQFNNGETKAINGITHIDYIGCESAGYTITTSLGNVFEIDFRNDVSEFHITTDEQAQLKAYVWEFQTGEAYKPWDWHTVLAYSLIEAQDILRISKLDSFIGKDPTRVYTIPTLI